MQVFGRVVSECIAAHLDYGWSAGLSLFRWLFRVLTARCLNHRWLLSQAHSIGKRTVDPRKLQSSCGVCPYTQPSHVSFTEETLSTHCSHARHLQVGLGLC